MSYDYLASPYSHSDPRVMEERYLAAMRCVEWYIQSNIMVFSPIVYHHEMAKRCYLPKDANFWMYFNRQMLERAKSLTILTLQGWEDSKGIKLEVDFAHDAKLPVSFIHPNVFMERIE